ncbi:PREDICTED: lon protease homolog 2, peroxisomal-like [Branchiostoma belcheri]|uniref:Lon protease homolog 2, peroxisomal n=1 Tax=Branchiostoma belcheri TaxID=7741 RepID=A0A6P5A6C0_BRABE|nr:PREDICTED: lon protease homolog 2, peroxisomal-like [Branchiostoma belcheri]
MAPRSVRIPRRLPILVVSGGVLLPGSSMRIPVHAPRNMQLVKNHVMKRSSLSSIIIGVATTTNKDPQTEDLEALHEIGTAAVVAQVTGTNWPKPAYTLLVTGLCRFKLDAFVQEMPYPIAQVTQLDKLPGDLTDENDEELSALLDTFKEKANVLVDMLDITVPVVAKLKKMLDSLPSQHLPDVFASIVKATFKEKLQVLDAVDLRERFEKTLPLLLRQIEGLRLLQNSKQQGNKKNREISNVRIVVKPPAEGGRRPVRIVQDQDEDGEVDEITELENKIKQANLPAQALKVATRELKRLKKMPAAMPDHAVIRNYLELMAELPWSKSSPNQLDITHAREELDADHYGLDKLKQRVMEYLAVRQLRNNLRGPILCFVGPPGVGKTSVGRSIAHILGREFHRISLGGVVDSSDIRGHRRTYIGSMPGRVIQGLRTVGTNNPLFLLDEVDKLGRSLQGDPASALLEVLDPEQNAHFTDHYLNVPFDLSQVIFIATANTTATIPPALLDRMEVISVPGYTQEEKHSIATRHLVPKQLKEHGLTGEQLQFSDEGLKTIIGRYTREAGVRTLERRLGAVCRAVAVKVAEGLPKPKQQAADNKESKEEDRTDEVHAVDEDMKVPHVDHPPNLPIVIDNHAVKDILGPPVFEHEVSQRLNQPGVAVGLAWTPMGGEIMFVEATRMDGDGQLTLTGQLGDVMKESAQLAISWLRSNALEYGLVQKAGQDLMESTDVHIHFPAGAIGKDGPSAGVTIVTVLASLFSGHVVRWDTAMTGEITLRGVVLPVGGIKEKVLAAHRAGITRIILPKRNEKDLQDIPSNVRKELTFILADQLSDVLKAAFDDGFPSSRQDRAVSSKL